jgi:hypothetical protein
LLINDSIEWFASYTSLDEAKQEFGIGVAKGVEPARVFGKLLKQRQDRPIVLWRTVWPTFRPDDSQDGVEESRSHTYISVYSLDEFRGLPKEFETAEGEVGDPTASTPKELAELIRRANSAIDAALQNYLSSERGGYQQRPNTGNVQ